MPFDDFVDFMNAKFPEKWYKSIDGTSIDRVLLLHVTKGNVHESLHSSGLYSKGGGSKKTAFDLTSPISMPAASSATWNAGLISSSPGTKPTTSLRTYQRTN